MTNSTSNFDSDRRQAIFDAFFRGYTSKQWGKSPEEIDPSIIKRVPVRNNYDVNYFNDYNQGIPLDGYNSLFDRLLDHPNIEVRCDSELRWRPRAETGMGVFTVFNLKTKEEIPLSTVTSHFPLSHLPIYYSGPIDKLFNYKFGALPWRSLRFETETLDLADYQGTTVVNYTAADVPYTRIHEFKHYHPERKDVLQSSRTIIMREYPQTWELGDEPYYPINSPESIELLVKYQAEVAKIDNLIVGGRLGGYKYYDMDQSIAAALAIDIEGC